MPKLIAMNGKKFNKLSVIEFAGIKGRFYMWLCKCDCGKFIECRGVSLRAGTTKSCGCVRKGVGKIRGLSRHPLYSVWNMMSQRCNNPNNHKYPRYGARGIKLCDRWKSVANFIEDMYPSYSTGMTIDRKDNNGDYCFENCRWVDQKTQQNNRSSNNGICALSEEIGVDRGTIKRRLVAGYSIEQIRQEFNTFGKLLRIGKRKPK